MKNKDLKKNARRILRLEMIIDQNEQSEAAKKAKAEIMSITSKINPEDMFLIDEMIQEMLENEDF
jgi:hypothetical protein